MSTAITVLLWMIITVIGIGVLLSVAAFVVFLLGVRKAAKEIAKENKIHRGFH